MDYKRKVRLSFPLVLSLLVLFLAAGCATSGLIVEDLRSGARSRESVIYAGTKYHIHEIPLYSTRGRMTLGAELEYSLRWWHYVDLPPCLCADTLLLPYTVPRTWWTHWKAQPTKEEVFIGPFIKKCADCYRNMRDLESDKYWYAHHHGLGPTDALPQNLDVYGAQVDAPYDEKPYYVCPSGGKYAVRGQNEEPRCTVHGTPTETMNAMKFIYREKRLPESRRDCLPKDSTQRTGGKDAGDRTSNVPQESMEGR